MKRKFNIGDFVIVDRCSKRPTLSEWLKKSPLGVGTVIQVRSYRIREESRCCYDVQPPLGSWKDAFYSWELNLVSRNEKKI